MTRDELRVIIAGLIGFEEWSRNVRETLERELASIPPSWNTWRVQIAEPTEPIHSDLMVPDVLAPLRRPPVQPS